MTVRTPASRGRSARPSQRTREVHSPVVVPVIRSDYSMVDPGVRGLVEALNALPGVATVESCEGHARGAPAWVAFVAHVPGTADRIAAILAPYLAHPFGEPRRGYEPGHVMLHPYAAYGVSIEWRLVVQHPDPRRKARLLRHVEEALRAASGAPPLVKPVQAST